MRSIRFVITLIVVVGAVLATAYFASAQNPPTEAEADLRTWALWGVRVDESTGKQQVFPLSQLGAEGAALMGSTPVTYTFSPGDMVQVVWAVQNDGPDVAASVSLSKTLTGWEAWPAMTEFLGDMAVGYWSSWGVAAYFEIPEGTPEGIYEITFYASSLTMDPDLTNNNVTVYLRVEWDYHLYLPAVMRPPVPESFQVSFSRDHEQDRRAVWLHLVNPLAANQQADWNVSCIGRDPWQEWLYYDPVSFDANGSGELHWLSLHGGWEERWEHEGHDQYGDCTLVVSSTGWVVTQSLYVDRTTVSYLSPWPDPNLDWIPPGTEEHDFLLWSPGPTLQGLPHSEVAEFVLEDGSYGQVRIVDGIWTQPLEAINGKFEVTVIMDGDGEWGYKTYHSFALLDHDQDPWVPSSAMQKRFNVIGLDEGGIYP